jgi:hypothetical protein
MIGWPGWVIMAPYGYVYFTYLQFEALIDLFEVLFAEAWWQDWFIYSFRRSVVGFTAFGFGVTLALFPFINLITLPFLAWLTTTDYYDYVYMVGPWTDNYLGETIEFMYT